MKHVKKKTHKEDIDAVSSIDSISFDNALAYARLIMSRLQ